MFKQKLYGTSPILFLRIRKSLENWILKMHTAQMPVNKVLLLLSLKNYCAETMKIDKLTKLINIINRETNDTSYGE